MIANFIDRMLNRTSGRYSAASRRLSPGSYDFYSGIYVSNGGGAALINKARILADTNPDIARYISMLTDNVIGAKGPVIEFDDPGVAAAFDVWKRKPSNFNHDWRSFLVDAFQRLPRDGEILAVSRMDEGRFWIETIDSLNLDFNKNDPSNNIYNAIRIDSDGNPLEYLFNDITAPASSVCHVYRRGPAKIRGKSWLLPALQSIEDLAKINKAVDKAALMKSFSPIFFTAPPKFDDDELPVTYAPGELVRLPKDSVMLDPKSKDMDAASMKEVEDRLLKRIAKGLRVSPMSLSGASDSGNNTSLRSAHSADVALYISAQEDFRQFLDFVVRAFMGSIGVVSEFEIIYPVIRPLDFRQQVQALSTAVNSKIMSRAQAIKILGEDPESTFEDIEREEERLNKNEQNENG